jgi:hypothetical protein
MEPLYSLIIASNRNRTYRADLPVMIRVSFSVRIRLIMVYGANFVQLKNKFQGQSTHYHVLGFLCYEHNPHIEEVNEKCIYDVHKTVDVHE